VKTRPAYRNENLDRRTRLRPPRQRLSSNVHVEHLGKNNLLIEPRTQVSAIRFPCQNRLNNAAAMRRSARFTDESESAGNYLLNAILRQVSRTSILSLGLGRESMT
jgi:hypothetical protein